jgi:hypothetical protein
MEFQTRQLLSLNEIYNLFFQAPLLLLRRRGGQVKGISLDLLNYMNEIVLAH